MSPSALTAADYRAFAQLARRRRPLSHETFGTCKLKIGKSEHANVVYDAVKDGKEIVDSVKTAASAAGKEAAEGLLKKLCDAMDWVQVLPLLGDALHQVQKEVTSFLSAIPCLGS